MNQRERKKLRCLERRADFLARLIAEDPAREHAWDREELGALRWAIRRLDTASRREPVSLEMLSEC